MQILVTGATSNLGADVALALRARGHAVRAVALPGLPRDHLDRAGIPLAFVDVTREEALVREADGVDAVVHCAGVVDLTRAGRERVLRVNVEGARATARAARRAGARRLVHISSIAVYGLPRGRARIDEATPIGRCGVAYNDSKLEGEAAVRAEVGPAALTVLRPVGIYGRYDRFLLPGIMRALRERIYVYLTDRARPFGLVGTRFLAEAITRLLDRPPPGAPECFIAAEGAPPPHHRVMEAIADEIGAPRPSITLPAPVAKAIGQLADAAAAVGLRPPIGSALLENALVDAVFDGSALRRHLDMEEVDSIAGVRGAVRELMRNG